ncbi:restriction endonuclease fold toxin [Chitinophaga skermanii]
MKHHLKLAEKWKKKLEYWFFYEPHPEVRAYLEKKGIKVVHFNENPKTR